MKISSFNGTNYQNSIKQNKKTEVIQINNYTQNNSLNTGMSDIMGRSQLGFKNKFKPTPMGYEYESNGRKGKRDTIRYDKENGSIEYGRGNQIVVFDPKTGTETTIIAQKDITTIKTVSKTEETITKKDKQGAIIYQLRQNKMTGEIEEYQRDIELGRIILKKSAKGKNEVKVLDLSTGNYVTSGRLTWVEETDGTSNIKTTRNVVTGALIEEESLDAKNPFRRLYNEETGRLSAESYYDKKNKLNVIKTYHDSGIMSAMVLSSAGGSYREFSQYGEDDKEIRHIVITRSSKTQETKVFVPNTAKIDHVRQDFKDEGDAKYTLIQYKMMPNTPESAKTFAADTNRLEKEVKYYEDGKTPYLITYYRADGSKTEEFRDKDNFIKHIDYFNSSNQQVSHIEYKKVSSLITGPSVKLFKAIDYDVQTGRKVEYYYDNNGEFYTDYYFREKDGTLIEKVRYFQNSNDVHILYKYENGMCTETEYDEEGDIVSTKQYTIYNKDETENDEEFENKFRYITLNGSSKNKIKDKQDTIEKIASIADNGGNIFEITDSEWNVVLEKMGLKDLSQLDCMDDNLYNKISKKVLSNMNAQNVEESRNLLSIARFFLRGGAIDC